MGSRGTFTPPGERRDGLGQALGHCRGKSGCPESKGLLKMVPGLLSHSGGFTRNAGGRRDHEPRPCVTMSWQRSGV